MLSKADDYPIHQTPEPIAFSGTDRNFYDRYFFNGFSDDGTVFFGAALGVYPHLNIIDAAFSVRIGDRQYSLKASRHLNMERMDIHVGPIRIEVLEPLQCLRITVDDNEHGIAAELTFQGRHFPMEEKRTHKRVGPRTLQDVTRMTQMGRYTGWLRAGGQEIRFGEDAPAHGVRDRSWGIRHVGERDPQVPVPVQEFQVWWFWVPVHLEDGILHFFVNEDGKGESWNQGLLFCPDNGSEIVHYRDPRMEVTFRPGTRWPTGATITARAPDGSDCTITVEPGANFYLSGLGYMHPEWSHGKNQGEFATFYDEIATIEVTNYAPPHQHVQAFANVAVTYGDGRTQQGKGAFEYIIIGRHDPSGLTSLFDVP